MSLGSSYFFQLFAPGSPFMPPDKEMDQAYSTCKNCSYLCAPL